MSTGLELTRAYVADSMTKILKYFKDGAKITVLVRSEDPEKDFMMTNDSLDEISAMIVRSKTRDGK